MKKLSAIILTFALMLTCLTACSSEKTDDKDDVTAPKTEIKSEVKLATLMGPTGMGMAYMLDDSDNGKTENAYTYEVCAAPDEITGKIVSGELDMAALPTNAAATLYNKSGGKVQILALNTECVLYVLEKENTIKSIADLKGKTVYVSGQGSTPEYILTYLLEANGLRVGTDVTLDFTYATHNDLVAFAASGKADVVLLPEPAVTALITKNADMKVALSLDDVWEDTVDDSENSKIGMGCVVVNTEFANENPEAVAAFLRDYKSSVERVTDEENIKASSEVIAKVGIVAAAGVAENALPRCSIVCVTGTEMKVQLEGFYKVLFDANPSSVGGTMPNDSFYYGA